MNTLNYFIDKVNSQYPFTYIDVGAMGGVPSKWHPMLEAMKVVAFEPDPREFAKLKSDDNIKYLNYALYENSVDLNYYIAKESGKSSLFEPDMELLSQYENSDRYSIVAQESIPAQRVKNLDNVIKDCDIFDVDFIKLDTQGSELSILTGGKKYFMPKVFGAQIEVEFVALYKKQPLFKDLAAFMDEAGFQLIDIRRQYWKRKGHYDYSGQGQLVFGDALYFKKVSVFAEELSKMENRDYTYSKVLKSIAISLVYKMFDYAIAVVKAGYDSGSFTKVQYKEAVETIEQYSSRGVPKIFRLNNKIYNSLQTVLQKFKPYSNLGWADSDRDIGNIRDK